MRREATVPKRNETGVPFAPVGVTYRLEGGAIAIVSAVLFVLAGFAWWWLLALFLVFDLSSIGYAINNRAGSFGYNLVHNFVAPSTLVAAYSILLNAGIAWWPLAFIAGCWFFHVGADRALGYGPRPSH
ncbi:MAG: DUF4260 domain-containing protein [Cryobacterium sp.]|nr:DUF4260 domain-containing protein [Cryobacterium sp.]